MDTSSNLGGFQNNADELKKPVKRREPTVCFHSEKTLENANKPIVTESRLVVPGTGAGWGRVGEQELK